MSYYVVLPPFLSNVDKYYYGDECSTITSTTKRVRELCKEKTSMCQLAPNANASGFVDACPNVAKQLKVWYQCVSMPGKNYEHLFDASNEHIFQANKLFFMLKVKTVIGSHAKAGGDRNSTQHECTFPFKYKNVEHHECIGERHAEYNGKKWCCLNADCDQSFEWGQCPGIFFYLVMSESHALVLTYLIY